MSPLIVPPSGVALEGSRTARTPDIISLKLGNNVIEEMIKCYNSKKPLQLSLGENPVRSYFVSRLSYSLYRVLLFC
jgi:hypothetical protein